MKILQFLLHRVCRCCKTLDQAADSGNDLVTDFGVGLRMKMRQARLQNFQRGRAQRLANHRAVGDEVKGGEPDVRLCVGKKRLHEVGLEVDPLMLGDLLACEGILIA